MVGGITNYTIWEQLVAHLQERATASINILVFLILEQD